MEKPKYHSLPKTQPTRNTSQNRLKTNESFYQILTCPEVSEFSLNETQKYIHHLNIDYGKILRPEQIQVKNNGKTININGVKEIMKSKEEKFLHHDTLFEEFQMTERRANPELHDNSLTQRTINIKQKNSSLKKMNKSVELPNKKNIIAGGTMKLKEVFAQKSGSSKKKLHTRIVKSYVAGGKMQIRLINYPDTSEYLRICCKNKKNALN